MKLKSMLLSLTILCLFAGQTRRTFGQTPAEPQGPLVNLETTYDEGANSPTATTLINVDEGDDLQSKLDQAAGNNGNVTVQITPGAKFVGNFHLKARQPNSGWVYIRPKVLTGISAAGVRIIPAKHAAAMPKLSTPNSSPALTVDAQANHYRLVGIEIMVEPAATYIFNLVTIGEPGETTLTNLPSYIYFDRCYVHGHSKAHLKRALEPNCSNFAIFESYVSEAHGLGQEAQAIGVYNGPGPFKITNNYLEGAGENVIFGGARPSINGLIPSDIEFKRNHVFKPESWRLPLVSAVTGTTAALVSSASALTAGTKYYYTVVAQFNGFGGSPTTPAASTEVSITPGAGQAVKISWRAWSNQGFTPIDYHVLRSTKAPGTGDRQWVRFSVGSGQTLSFTDTGGATPRGWVIEAHWTVKNLFELKNAQRVVIDGNVFEHNWADAQAGFAILFTPRPNDSGGAAVVENVQFTNNIVRRVGGAMHVTGADDLAPGTGVRGRIIKIANNLFENVDGGPWWGTGDFLKVGAQATSVTVDHNTVFHSGKAIATWGGPMQNFVFRNNLMRHNQYGVVGDSVGNGNDTLNTYFPGYVFQRNVIAGAPASRYPADNYYPAFIDDVKFYNRPKGKYSPTITPYKTGATDGTAIGINQTALDAATKNVAPTSQSAVLPLRLNAGGSLYNGAAGITWQTDTYAQNGETYEAAARSPNDILNTTNDALYRSERFGGAFGQPPLSYAIPVPNGTYTVRLHFAEIWWGVDGHGGGVGKRVFNVSLEGTQVLTNYDIYARAKVPLKAVVEQRQATVNDGVLNIDLSATSALKDNAKISAIEVIVPTSAAAAETVFWTDPVGVTVDGDSLTETGDIAGWGAGAVSTQSLSGNGYVEFSTDEANTNKACGLSYASNSQNYTEIDYAILLGGTGLVRVYENGALIGIFGSYAAGDRFRVAVEGGVVNYYQNEELLYTSTITPTYPLLVDSSLSTLGATITNATLIVTPPYLPLADVLWTYPVGVTVNGNSLTETANAAGWGAGAVSTQSLSGDGYVEFSPGETTTSKMCGLSYGSNSQNYTEIDYAISLGGSSAIRVYENGVLIGVFGYYAVGDRFRVAVEGGVVNYYKNEELFYTSEVTPTYPLLVDTSLDTYGATIKNAVISGAWSY
jgi:hypothetical protein